MIQQYAQARGMSVLEIFKQAYRMYGLSYPLGNAEEMYEKWNGGWCVLPVYVYKWLNNELKREDIAEQPFLPFV